MVALLRVLGFRKVARHASKSVVVYQQGRIRIVVNTESTGFANAAFNVHGTTAYAVGLKVADARQAVVRAVGLGAEEFIQQPGPGETKLPGVFGPGGGVYYFLDHSEELENIWTAEFVTEDETAPTLPAGLDAIDHIAQTVRYDELLSTVLFYTSLFKAEKTPVVDIIDPAGVVRSQVVANETGSMRITLNGAENHRTFAGHFITENFGPSIQHVAFRTDDILATATALAANGFRPLEISRNYYDDIEARFGLEPDFAEKLRANNILYDRDEGGDYFQLYSPVYGEGFFFEIVQRRGYRGYGAPNAIFRIAAQKRHMRPETMPRS